MDEAERKRQERNRKQREYRAKRKADESEEIRKERNKRRQEQRLFNRTESLTTINFMEYWTGASLFDHVTQVIS